MLEKLFLNLKGYLILELKEGQRERFINLCKNKEIEIIHIFEINNTWFCKMSVKDYKTVKELVNKTECCPYIRKKCGLPFWLYHIQKRKGCILGFFLFFCMLHQCTGRIWSIEVQGGYVHTREQILQVLKDSMKIYGGIPSDSVDCFEIEKQLRLDYNEIGWISVEKKGCHLSIMLNESVMPQIPEKEEEVRHIVADRDGTVRSVEVLQGIPLVKTGDQVRKGDILISGIVPIVGDYDTLLRNRTVSARGTVNIETELTYESSFPLRYKQKKITDEVWGIGLFLSEQKIFSYIPRYSEGEYDIISVDLVPYVFKNYKAPVIIRKYRCLSYLTEQVTMSETEAKQKANYLWKRFLEDLLEQGIQILQSDLINEIRHGQCRSLGRATVCGNFISYQEIMEEEWERKNEYSGDNP